MAQTPETRLEVGRIPEGSHIEPPAERGSERFSWKKVALVAGVVSVLVVGMPLTADLLFYGSGSSPFYLILGATGLSLGTVHSVTMQVKTGGQRYW